jgi:flagellar biosynthetic protein FliQ
MHVQSQHGDAGWRDAGKLADGQRRLAGARQHKERIMSPELVINLVQNALYILIIVSAPVLLVSLVVGLLVSVLQAATQINEMTLTFIPKLLAMFLVLVLAGPWMLNTLVEYTTRLFQSIPSVIG